MNKSIKRTIAAISMTAMLAAGFAMPVSAATQVEVTGNPVMIRADAGLKNTVVSRAHKGDKYTYVGQKKDSTGSVWYNIKYSGNKTGWITSQFAKKTEDQTAEQPAAIAKQVQITGNTVMVRANAGTNYKKLGSTSKGKTYTCLASKKDSSGRVWYQIQYTSNTKGWVTSQFAKLVDGNQQPAATTNQVQITGSSVNVRSGSGANYKKLGSTSKGKKYTYLASKKASNGRVWYQIQYTSNTKGWVSSGYAKLVNGTTDVKDNESSALMQGVYKKLTAADSSYTEWKSGFSTTTFAEKLNGENIVITAKGEEGLNGTYTFKHDGDYITYTTADKEDFSGYSVFMFIRDAVGDYYGMNSTLMNGYLAGLGNFGFENKYLIIDMEKGEYKIYSASKWNMKELDKMYVNESALEYTSALTEDDTNKLINSGKITVVTYGNKDHLKMFVYEYGDKNTDLTYKSIMTVMNKIQPTDYKLFIQYYNELKEVKDMDGFTVTFGLDKNIEEEGGITGMDDYSCVTIIYNASK